MLQTIPQLYPQVTLEDRDLDGFRRLFDGEWVWRTYCSQFGEPPLGPRQIRIRQVSHNPGRHVIVSYVAEWEDDDYVPPEQFAFEIARGREPNLYRYPEDPHLPGLGEAASVEGGVRLLNKYVLSFPARRLRVDMVRYRPGNRAVLRHRLGKFSFYVRVMRPKVMGPLLEAGRLAEHSGFVLPRVAGHWPEGGVIWLSEIPGKNLRGQIRRGDQPPPDTLLDGLERLWAVPPEPSGTRPFNLAGAYRRARRAFTRAVPDGEARPPELAAATRALDGFVEAWRPSHMAHNDFYDDQMLVLPDGRIALVDFEEAGPGDPMLDVGNFLAHLRWGANFGREKDAGAVGAFHGVLRSAALERFGWNERELALREAVCLFRVCTNAIRHPREDWRDRLRAGLALVNETLGG